MNDPVFEDNDFLNRVDMGYIGLSKPLVAVLPLNDGVIWVDDDDQDNWAGSPEQAWA